MMNDQTQAWKEALKANRQRSPKCSRLGIRNESQIKVECNCSQTTEIQAIVYECQIPNINRCLPHYHPQNETRVRWLERKPESDIYQLCDACEHFQFKGPNQ